MPVEIETINHQPPYNPPLPLQQIGQLPAGPAKDMVRELAREVERLRESIETYRQQLHHEQVSAFSELSASVNTLFDRFNRMPILPEITTPTTNTVAFTNEGSGVVSIDVGQKWLMRGNLVVDTDDFTTAQRQFTTTASKTYHVRWDATNGIRYIDTTDATYNPGALPENDDTFASTETDILLQKIVTDGSNVPTFTTVLNRGHYTSMDSSESNVKIENTLSGADIELNTIGAGAIVHNAFTTMNGNARVVDTIPFYYIRDSDSSGSAARGFIRWEDSAVATLVEVALQSGGDADFTIENFQSGGDIELTTNDGEVHVNSGTPKIQMTDDDAASDTATTAILSLGRTADLDLGEIGFLLGSNDHLTVENRIGSGNINLRTSSGLIDVGGSDIRLTGVPTASIITHGSGSPEGVKTANPGSIYMNVTGGAGVSVYFKESGTGNTGWVAK